MDVLSLIVSGCAFLVSLAALLAAYLQLHEARTSTGGRGMQLRFRPLASDEVSYEEYEEINEILVESQEDLVPFLLSVEVTGPAEFFDVIAYTWAPVGAPNAHGAHNPIKRLTCDSGPVDFVLIFPRALLKEIKLGVVWRQPWLKGLETGAIRSSMGGPLEEWVYFSRLRRRFSRKAIAGTWRERHDDLPDFGPVSQPWQHPKNTNQSQKTNK